MVVDVDKEDNKESNCLYLGTSERDVHQGFRPFQVIALFHHQHKPVSITFYFRGQRTDGDGGAGREGDGADDGAREGCQVCGQERLLKHWCLASSSAGLGVKEPAHGLPSHTSQHGHETGSKEEKYSLHIFLQS